MTKKSDLTGDSLNKEISFEEALSELEKTAENLRRDDITLDEAMKTFEKGTNLYKICSEILESANQKIEVYLKENDYEQ